MIYNNMNIKEFYLKNFINYAKHKSSYFNLPASVMVLIAYLLPGFLSMININFSPFASLILIAVAIFEKQSNMVRLYCLQFCIMSVVFNVFLTILSIVAMFIPIAGLIGAMCSIVIATITIFVYIYSIFNAFRYKGWIIPWIGNLVVNKIMKI